VAGRPLGRRRKPNAVTSQTQALLRAEYDAGDTLRQIAAKHDLAVSTVQYHVRRPGTGNDRRVPLHGTQRGWLRHGEAREKPCGPCMFAHQAWTVGLAMMAADEE